MLGGSDHIPFYREGIDSVCFFSKNHDFIHSIGDSLDKFEIKNVIQCSELIYRIILEIDRRVSLIIESGSKKL